MSDGTLAAAQSESGKACAKHKNGRGQGNGCYGVGLVENGPVGHGGPNMESRAETGNRLVTIMCHLHDSSMWGAREIPVSNQEL